MAVRDIEEANLAVFHLANFDPTSKDEYGSQLADYLVLDALAAHGQLKVTALDVKTYLRQTFKVEFEEAEIDASASRLESRGFVETQKVSRYESLQLQVTAQGEEKVNGSIQEIRRIESEVLSSWQAEICKKYSEISAVSENIETIVVCLQKFLVNMLRRHGAECTGLLYPGNKKAESWMQTVKGDLLGELRVKDSFIDAVVRLEVPQFFGQDDPQRRKYVTALVNASFFWHLAQVDDKCSNLLRGAVSGQKLYLDNNVLYCLMGFHGADMLRTEHNLIKLAKALGYELWVTTKTQDEFHNSLRWQIREQKKKLAMPTELARIAAANVAKDSFVASYWTDLAEHGTTIEDFVAERSHLDEVLEGLDVRITNKYRSEIEVSDRLRQEESALRSVKGYEKNVHVIEHDAFHRILIHKYRKGLKFRMHEAVAWFLTHDHQLPDYDRVASRGKQALPFCITAEHWIQVNRPLLKRSVNQDLLDSSFDVLVTQPFLRAATSSFSFERAYADVTGRISRYKNMTQELALRVVADRHFMLSMTAEQDSGVREQKIDNRIVQAATEVQSEAQELRQAVKTQRDKADTLANGYSRQEKRIKTLEATARVLSDNLEVVLEDKQALASQGGEQVAAISKLTDEKSDLALRFTAYRAQVKKWSLGLALFLVLTFMLWLSRSWWFNDQVGFKATIAANGLLLFATLCIPMKKHWITWLSIALAFFIAFLSLPN